MALIKKILTGQWIRGESFTIRFLKSFKCGENDSAVVKLTLKYLKYMAHIILITRIFRAYLERYIIYRI